MQPLRDCLVVADRGMIRAKTIEALESAELGMNHIL
jgi:hypothetical protein